MQVGNDTTDQTTLFYHPAKPLSPNEMEVIEWVICNCNKLDLRTAFLHFRRSKMQGRSSHLQEKCSFYGLDTHGNDTLHRPNPWEFLINKKHHLVWCNVFKAASTSWMYNFNLLAGYSPQFLKKTNVVPLTLARKKYPRPSIQEVGLKSFLCIITFFLLYRYFHQQWIFNNRKCYHKRINIERIHFRQEICIKTLKVLWIDRVLDHNIFQRNTFEYWVFKLPKDPQ